MMRLIQSIVDGGAALFSCCRTCKLARKLVRNSGQGLVESSEPRRPRRWCPGLFIRNTLHLTSDHFAQPICSQHSYSETPDCRIDECSPKTSDTRLATRKCS